MANFAKFLEGYLSKIALLPIGGGTIEALRHVPRQNLATQEKKNN